VFFTMYYQQLAAKYRALATAKDRGDYGDSPQTRSLRIAAEAGARLNETLGDWADWAKWLIHFTAGCLIWWWDADAGSALSRLVRGAEGVVPR